MFSLGVHAANQNYTAVYTGSDGSTGTVNYTVDDSLASAGSNIFASPGCGAAAPVLKAFSLTITGGSTPSGTQTWNCSQVGLFFCGGPASAAAACTTMLTFDLNANGATYTYASSGPVTGIPSWGGATGTTSGAALGAPTTVSAPIDLNFSKTPQTFASEIEIK